MSYPFRPILIFSIVILLSGCYAKNKTSPTGVATDFRTISIDTNMQVMNTSALASKIDYIPLETSEQDIIGKVDKIAFFDDKFFILDRQLSKCLFVFDKTGRLLYHKKAGENGAQRLRSVTDFAIDKANKQLYIYDNDASKIYVFQQEDGTYISSAAERGHFSGIALTDSGNIALLRDGLISYKDDYMDRVCLFDPALKIRKSWFDTPLLPSANAGDMISVKSTDEKRVLIARMFCDTIYALQQGQLTAVGRVDPGRQAMPASLLTAKDVDEAKAIMEDKNSFYILENIFDTRRYWGFYYKVHEHVCLVLDDKRSHQTSVIRSLDNDIDNTLLHPMIYMDDSCFIGVLTAAELQQQYHLLSSDTSFQKKYKTLIALNSRITQDSNPVIVLGTLK